MSRQVLVGRLYWEWESKFGGGKFEGQHGKGMMQRVDIAGWVRFGWRK